MAETLRNASGGGIPIFLPFFLGVAVVDPPHGQPGEPREQLVVINPLARSMVVLETGGDSSFEDLFQKRGWRPASKAAIDALPSVEVAADGDEECPVCLEGWGGGETAKEMPCKHRFHGGCIEKWLNVSGSCPVCRYQMPEEARNRDERENAEEIWMSFGFGRGR